MGKVIRMDLPSLGAGALVLVAALTVGACSDDAFCGDPPSEPITRFIVTTTTGSDGTNANIYFCYTRRSTGSREQCLILDELFADDFEAHEVNRFQLTLDPPIAPGDLDQFLIRNTGGGISIANLFGNDSWGMAALTVEAVLESGVTVVLFEKETPETLDEGEEYDSSQCPY